ncbi:MAG: DUF4386 domain-containing protein [Anaerolineae bacterium]|nr:DUF4386 domain-containing protein [Anaerolineae bacterium]
MSKRKAASMMGILYITGTVAGVLSAILSAPIFESPDDLANIAANGNQLIIGALFVLLMGLSLSMIPVVGYPVLRKHDETLAAGYLIFRGALECFTYLATVVCWFMLLALSREAADGLQPLGPVLVASSDWISRLTQIIFPIGAVMFYAILYRFKLIPRWLTVWGFIGLALHVLEVFLTMFGVLPDNLVFVFALPIALQEMVMAVWFIAKGFNPDAAAPETI